jgi:hypothetical protein
MPKSKQKDLFETSYTNETNKEDMIMKKVSANGKGNGKAKGNAMEKLEKVNMVLDIAKNGVELVGKGHDVAEKVFFDESDIAEHRKALQNLKALCDIEDYDELKKALKTTDVDKLSEEDVFRIGLKLAFYSVYPASGCAWKRWTVSCANDPDYETLFEYRGWRVTEWRWNRSSNKIKGLLPAKTWAYTLMGPSPKCLRFAECKSKSHCEAKQQLLNSFRSMIKGFAS